MPRRITITISDSDYVLLLRYVKHYYYAGVSCAVKAMLDEVLGDFMVEVKT